MAKNNKQTNYAAKILGSTMNKINQTNDSFSENIEDGSYKEDITYYGTPEMFNPYPDDKLRLPLREGEQRQNLKESFINLGITNPILCTLDNDEQLIILEGHNRVDIAKEIIEEGNTDFKIPFRVKLNLSKEMQELMVIDDNILQRQLEEVPPSMLAYVIKIKRDAEAHQGKRNLINSNGEDEELNRNTDFTSWTKNNQWHLGKTQMLKYVKLNNLTSDFKDMVDSKVISLSIAYDIAFLTEEEQTLLYDYIVKNKIKISSKNSEMIRKEKPLEITEEKLEKIFNTEKKPVTPNKYACSMVRKYLPDSKDEDIEDIINKALQMYAQSKLTNE